MINLAVRLRNAGKSTEALLILDKALIVDPQSEAARIAKMAALVDIKEFDAAE